MVPQEGDSTRDLTTSSSFLAALNLPDSASTTFLDSALAQAYSIFTSSLHLSDDGTAIPIYAWERLTSEPGTVTLFASLLSQPASTSEAAALNLQRTRRWSWPKERLDSFDDIQDHWETTALPAI